MPTFAYLDSSALVKLAATEADTSALEHAVLGRDALFSSTLGATELGRAVRRTGSRPLMQQAQDVLACVFLVEFTASIRAHAARLEPVALRTLDAIHLASAVSLAIAGLDFITYDDRLAEAAEAHGLLVSQPGRKPRRGSSGRSRSS